jgi:hypothetical protein
MAGMVEPPAASWSEAVGEADWIRERLTPFAAHVVASVVPGGFEAYARVLHPAAVFAPGEGPPVRWRDVAAWSGTSVRSDTQYHSIALPPTRPAGEAPWKGQHGPSIGTLYPPDVLVLAELLRAATRTPEHCFLCVWEGYGWEGHWLIPRRREPSELIPGPVPEPVLRAPRVRLPNRDYLLYTGCVEDAVTSALFGHVLHQPANLWWPEDRAWCVASEIDLPWTYVGGSAAVIERVLADPRIEAVPATVDDPVTRVEEWVRAWVDAGVAALLATGEATITTSMGTLEASLERPGRFRSGALQCGRGGWSLPPSNEAGLRRTLSAYLTHAVIGLVGG